MGVDEGIKPIAVASNNGHEKQIAEDNLTVTEVDSEKGDVEQAKYSKLSVWLMVVYSGLAIGSDGYNAAVIGNVELLLAVLYPKPTQQCIPLVLTASECFPTAIRGQMIGLVAAWSKVGAAIGTQVFSAILASWSDGQKGDQATFLIGSSFAVLGALIAWLVMPDVSARLEDEDQAWKEYLACNGWEAEFGDTTSTDPAAVKMDVVVS
ncbi:hypothetical protein AC579_5745 [Pseudocercospora musae]|uniref:Major facilitator superfamily (MFS) profile domain-containing protein n=1 Tax=Pseudocercospora musae TaxID=113226 RepID=A0A139IS39_9PEZI|nr:hypothetical protein AC579_5745 [Pseudocercospora musae]